MAAYCEHADPVRKFLSDAYKSALEILSFRRDQLDHVANELLKRETLDEQAFNALIGRQRNPASQFVRPRWRPEIRCSSRLQVQ